MKLHQSEIVGERDYDEKNESVEDKDDRVKKVTTNLVKIKN